MSGNKKAFTFVELIIVLIFTGILTVIAVPRLNIAVISRSKADYTARKLVTDLRRTRVMAITSAANNTDGFALKMVGTSPYASYEIVNLSDSSTVVTHSIDSAVSCTGGNDFKFGPLGNLLSGSGSYLNISSEGKSFTIMLVSTTGTVKCIEN